MDKQEKIAELKLYAKCAELKSETIQNKHETDNLGADDLDEIIEELNHALTTARQIRLDEYGWPIPDDTVLGGVAAVSVHTADNSHTSAGGDGVDEMDLEDALDDADVIIENLDD